MVLRGVVRRGVLIAVTAAALSGCGPGGTAGFGPVDPLPTPTVTPTPTPTS